MWRSSWVVGVDFTETSHGALEFAKWLRSHFVGDELEEIAVHVVEPRGILQRFGLSMGGEAPTTRAWRRLRALASSHETRFDDVESVTASSAATELPHAAYRRRASGLIIGRHGPAQRWSWSALGRTSRKLVDSADVPVIVVPPDLDAEQIGQGPIIAVVDPAGGSEAALRFADRLSHLLNRPLLAVSVVDSLSSPLEDDEGSTRAAETASAGPSGVDAMRRARRGATQRLISAMRHARIWPRPTRIEAGRTVPCIHRIAAEEDACLIVCGHGEPRLEQMFAPFPSSDLAAHARTPVCIVPSSFEPGPLT